MTLFPLQPKNKNKNHRKRKIEERIRGKNGNTEKWDEEEEERDFWNWRESTAKGMFSWSGLHLLRWGGCGLYIMALNTAETVGMYAVLLRASSHVSPISWQSLLSILVPLAVVAFSSFPFLYPPLSCNPSNFENQQDLRKLNKKKNRKGCVWKGSDSVLWVIQNRKVSEKAHLQLFAT